MGPDQQNPTDKAPTSAPKPKLFSDEQARAALEELKAIIAAQEVAAAAPQPPVQPEAVEMSAEELAAHPEKARTAFESTVSEIREGFEEWLAAKENQFYQLLEFGWSGGFQNMNEFFKHLEEENKRLWCEAEITTSSVDSTALAMESVLADEIQREINPERPDEKEGP